MYNLGCKPQGLVFNSTKKRNKLSRNVFGRAGNTARFGAGAACVR